VILWPGKIGSMCWVTGRQKHRAPWQPGPPGEPASSSWGSAFSTVLLAGVGIALESLEAGERLIWVLVSQAQVKLVSGHRLHMEVAAKMLDG
jgi:hypothetical protein